MRPNILSLHDHLRPIAHIFKIDATRNDKFLFFSILQFDSDPLEQSVIDILDGMNALGVYPSWHPFLPGTSARMGRPVLSIVIQVRKTCYNKYTWPAMGVHIFDLAWPNNHFYHPNFSVFEHNHVVFRSSDDSVKFFGSSQNKWGPPGTIIFS